MGGGGALGGYSGIGPITVFLIDDAGFVGPGGKPLPQCVFTAMSDPANKQASQKLFA